MCVCVCECVMSVCVCVCVCVIISGTFSDKRLRFHFNEPVWFRIHLVSIWHDSLFTVTQTL